MNHQINKNILRATSYSYVICTLLRGTQLWVRGDVRGLKFRRPFLWWVMGFSLFLFFYFIFLLLYNCCRSFPSGWTVKNLSANKGDAGSVFGLRRSPGEGHGISLQYSCLGNRLAEKPGRLQSMGSQRVGHDWATELNISISCPVPTHVENIEHSRSCSFYLVSCLYYCNKWIKPHHYFHLDLS